MPSREQILITWSGSTTCSAIPPSIMQPLNPFRGYSDFFKGFRAFGRKRSSETASHPVLDTPKITFSEATVRRPRPVSMQNTSCEKEATSRRRRSSFIPFSSHWFDHQQQSSTSDLFNATSTTSLRRSSTCSTESADSEVWRVGGDLYTVPTINERYDAFLSK